MAVEVYWEVQHIVQLGQIGVWAPLRGERFHDEDEAYAAYDSALADLDERLRLVRVETHGLAAASARVRSSRGN